MGRRRPKKRLPPPSESEDKAGKEDEDAFIYPVGAEVEVRTDEPGFEGSFYEATVTGHLISSRGGRRYTLAYSTLLAQEGAPLKETAAAADVRPRPPPEENARREFAICEMVEAFHNDGWWAGVVSAVPTPVTGDRPRGLYEVTFPNSREIIEFEQTALRPHRVFQDGRWVPAAEVENARPLFSEGSQIEVSRSAENFGESWSPATVLEVIGAHFLVQYIHIEKNGKLATAIVDSQYIRPARVVTSMGSRYRFPPSSHVEVLHQGSWWPGVIVKVSGSGINKKYVVKFKNQETYIKDIDCMGELKVENTHLRQRYDWDGKKWVVYIEKKPAKGRQLTSRKRPIYVSIALNDEGDGSCRDKKLRKSPIYSSLELDDEGDGSCRAKKLKKADVACDKNLKKADVVSESISPLMSVREEYVIDHKSCSYPEETMEQQNVVLALGCQFPLHSLAPMTAPGHLSSSSLSLSCHLEQPSQIIKGPFLGTQSRNSDWSEIESTDQEKQSTVGSRTDLSRQKEDCVSFQTPDALGSTETLQPKKGITPKSIEEDNNSMAIFEDLAQLPNDMIAGCETLPEMNKVSFIDLTPRKGIRVSQETSGIHDLQLGGYAAETSAEQDTGEDLCQRYLVMPADDYVDSLPSAKSCEATVHGDQLNRTAIVECRTGYVAPAEDLSVVCPATLDGVVPNLLQSGANLEVIESHTEELSESSQSIKKSTATRMSSVGTSNRSETGPGNSLDIVKAMAGTPIPKCVSSRTHDSCCPLSKQSVDVRQGIIDMSGGLSESLATQRLPFVKKSPIWAELEVLEIFKKAPQRPNFHQLQQYLPDLREGMALGLMLSFDNLAESISRLEVQDDSGPLEQKMLGLSLLEANGFDVRDMRSRLETLLHKRSSRVKLQDAMKKLGEDRSERN